VSGSIKRPAGNSPLALLIKLAGLENDFVLVPVATTNLCSLDSVIS
jgi:hypothetical protein